PPTSIGKRVSTGGADDRPSLHSDEGSRDLQCLGLLCERCHFSRGSAVGFRPPHAHPDLEPDSESIVPLLAGGSAVVVRGNRGKGRAGGAPRPPRPQDPEQNCFESHSTPSSSQMSPPCGAS